MDVLSSSWIIGLIAFMLGTGVGVAIHRMLGSEEVRSRKLENEMDQLQHDFDIYKETVGKHFDKTSELFNNLTEDYVKVYRHLSEGASKLTEEEQPAPQLSQKSQLNQQQEDKLVDLMTDTDPAVATPKVSSVEQPKDYAPKNEHEQGTLSEAYSASNGQREAS